MVYAMSIEDLSLNVVQLHCRIHRNLDQYSFCVEECMWIYIVVVAMSEGTETSLVAMSDSNPSSLKLWHSRPLL